ncbi:hypothetical protein NQ318_017515 [Aromia moschata]|uniref:Uncharacterized protein n=1 Tax=Aromia moschata TaxID=1265417 RepID=A0AAV8Z1B1_9CUCU|nr:hypothetical protein NQ318_017515 [Aromia moschata]
MTFQATVLRILRKENYHPYKFQLVQELNEDDPERQLLFCETMMNLCQTNPNLRQQILFSDEATSKRHSDPSKLQVLESDESSLDHRSTYSTSAEIKCVGRNRAFLLSLTGERYLEFLQNDLYTILLMHSFDQSPYFIIITYQKLWNLTPLLYLIFFNTYLEPKTSDWRSGKWYFLESVERRSVIRLYESSSNLAVGQCHHQVFSDSLQKKSDDLEFCDWDIFDDTRAHFYDSFLHKTLILITYRFVRQRCTLLSILQSQQDNDTNDKFQIVAFVSPGDLKQKVYSVSIENEEQLWNIIQNAVQELQNEETLRRVHFNFSQN